MAVKKQNKKTTVPTKERNVTITDLNISGFFDKDYMRFAKYASIRRAIPSLVDGFKSGARKIMHACMTGNTKIGIDVKTINIVGDIFQYSAYDHGDASLYDTLLTLSKDFADNLAPLIVKGQGGSLRDPNASAAPRYLYMRLTKFANMLYKTDSDILKYDIYEGATHEPRYYLPIIPTVLMSNTSGIGVGWYFSCMSYNPIDVIRAIRNYVAYGYLSQIRPYTKGLSQDARWFEIDGQWYSQGHYEIELPKAKNDQYKIIVNEWPHDKTFEGMEKHYNMLITGGDNPTSLKTFPPDLIDEWVNRSRGNSLRYELIFKNKAQFDNFIKNKDVLENKYLQNISKTRPNTLTVTDENNKIRIFDNIQELIMYFVKFRLNVYNERKANTLDRIEKRIERINMLTKFIQHVIDGDIILSNRAMSAVKKDLDKFKITHDVLSMAISKITKEEFAKLKQELKDIKQELEITKNTSIEELYLNDLGALEDSIIDDFLDQDEIEAEIEFITPKE